MSVKKIPDQILVIFGASGDLTYRKLIPAIFDLHTTDALAKHFAVLGVARTEMTHETFRKKMEKGIRAFAKSGKDASEDVIHAFCDKLFYQAINTAAADEYVLLKEQLASLGASQNIPPNYIFYLSTPPSMYEIIPAYLAKQGLNDESDGFKRIIIEKPFGVNLESAKALNISLLKTYKEEQIYRIDHYLGKETAQNIFVTRFANSIYEPLWNRNYIDHVEITAAESIGVENRGSYYEHAGAMRDMIQNHLLQLLALVAMEPPMAIDSLSVRNEKMKVFQALRPFTPAELETNIIRGQYTKSTVRDEILPGYREEPGVDPESRTETYFAMKTYIDNWRWGGVPFYLRTGKRLPTRVTEIVVHFKPTPFALFVENKEFCNDGNLLVLRIQPDEGILLKTGMKVPGRGYQVQNVNIDFLYSELKDTYVPEAYERLLLDCMMGDSTLYIRGDALEETWKYVQPILDYCNNHPETPLHGYPAGTWGPAESDQLIEGPSMRWRYPCRNLSGDGDYCDL